MKALTPPKTPDQLELLRTSFVQLARLSLASDRVEMTPPLRKMARQLRASDPDIATQLVELLRASPARGVTALSPDMATPVDNESRLPLLRVEDPVILRVEPIFSSEVQQTLGQIADEYREPQALLQAGLGATRTALFVGPPGVGKTLAARWLAHQLDRPLLVLDLASVMSSLLGKTGENLRRVLEAGKRTPCVLLLDELDAVAKRRDDQGEVGELKRLVTVLLQEIDAWPEGSLLLAATNHAELLDPAVWRRFEVVLDFPKPDRQYLYAAINEFSGEQPLNQDVQDILVLLFEGSSYSDVEREIMRARRISAVQNRDFLESILSLSRARFEKLSQGDRISMATRLQKAGTLSQRGINDVTGVSRDTLRKYAREGVDDRMIEETENA